MSKSFEDFPTYKLTLNVIKEIESICNNSRQNQFVFIKDQIRRASSSILLNLAEGSTRWGKKDKIHFYRMSCASASECIAACELLNSYGIIKREKTEETKSMLREISLGLQALIRSIQNRP